jgi:hypothetical protein
MDAFPFGNRAKVFQAAHTQESHRRAEQIYGTANCALEVRVSSISHASRTTTLIFKLGIDPSAKCNLLSCPFFFSILKTRNAES